MLSDEKRAALIQMCHEAGVMLIRDSKFGHPDYTSVQSSWPAMEKLARAVAEAAVKDAVGGDEPQPSFMRPDRWTLLLVGDNNGLVGQYGCKFPTHPMYYERVNVYTRPQASAAVPDLSECFMTAESGGGEYKIVMRFQTLANMQVAHTAMVHWLAASQPEVK